LARHTALAHARALTSPRPLLLLAAAGAALAMFCVLFFACAVTYATGTSRSTFVATLAAFLLGLAAGAHRAGRHCALFSAEELMRRAAPRAMAAHVIALMALPLLDPLAPLAPAVIAPA